jgi:taurine dioxygenase
MNAIVKFPSLAELNAGTPAGLELEHLSPTIGTVVHGIDLTKPLSDEMFGFLHRLLMDRQVIFFRDQDISLEQHLEVCRRWGSLETIPFLQHHPDYPELLHIKRDKDNKSYENIWHHDVTWRTEPSFGSMLRAVSVPDIGGDTMFSDMYAAYEGLPEPIKRACEGLEAVHSINVSLGVYADADKLHEMSKRFPPATHPVIRVHPETGRKLIFVNRAHTSYIKGLRRDDSRYLLDYLCDQAAKPEYQCRFRWVANSIAFWDNRSCQHYAVADYFPKPREMYRVTIAGDRPC